MKEKIKTIGCTLLLMVALPYIFTMAFQGKRAEENLQVNEREDLEKYVISVVAQEIPVHYEIEALKAQAVIARTNIQSALEKEEQLPELLSQEELLSLWGKENFSSNYQQVTEAVQATENIVMRYQGNYIYAAFHAVSAGKTRSASDALHTEDMPWLQSVESDVDIPSKDYLKVIFLEKEEFAEKISRIFPETVVELENPLKNIKIIARDESEYVQEVKLGEKVVSGEEFRRAMELNSACFYIKEVEDEIRIVTKGLGHGLGMSQYGANVMASEGVAYQEILSYYFKNIEISD